MFVFFAFAERADSWGWDGSIQAYCRWWSGYSKGKHGFSAFLYSNAWLLGRTCLWYLPCFHPPLKTFCCYFMVKTLNKNLSSSVCTGVTEPGTYRIAVVSWAREECVIIWHIMVFNWHVCWRSSKLCSCDPLHGSQVVLVQTTWLPHAEDCWKLKDLFWYLLQYRHQYMYHVVDDQNCRVLIRWNLFPGSSLFFS